MLRTDMGTSHPSEVCEQVSGVVEQAFHVVISAGQFVSYVGASLAAEYVVYGVWLSTVQAAGVFDGPKSGQVSSG